MYGVNETNPLGVPYEQTEYAKAERCLNWADPELKQITRLRLLSDPGFPYWDVSYCYGKTHDGETVRVYVPFSQLPKRAIQTTIVLYAKKDKVYAKGLGIFAAISTLC